MTNVNVSCVPYSDWISGYCANIVITNNNSYDILKWQLSFTMKDTLNYGFVDCDSILNANNIYTIFPKDWIQTIKAGATLKIDFGAHSSANKPSNFNFVQLSVNTNPVPPVVNPVPPVINPVPPVINPVPPVVNPVPNPNKFISVGYYPNYAIYGRNFHPADIQIDKLDIVLMAFMCMMPNDADYATLVKGWQFPIVQADYNSYKTQGIKEGAIISQDNWADIGSQVRTLDMNGNVITVPGVINGLKSLRKRKPSLKVVISIGGWSLSWNISKILKDMTLRQNFINSVLKLAQDPDIGGIDIDWEYPQLNKGLSFNYVDPTDPQNLAATLQALRTGLDNMGRKDFLLMAAIGADPAVISLYKDSIQYLNYVSLMTYDFDSGSWSNTGGYHTCLYKSSSDIKNYTPNGFWTDAAVKNMLALGCPASKVLIGSPMYARGFSNLPVSNPDTIFNTCSGAPASFDPAAIAENGSSSWKSIRAEIDAGRLTDLYDDSAKASFGRHQNGSVWSYESSKSLTAKLDYMNSNSLAGVFFWEITSDAMTPNSLLKTANDYILNPPTSVVVNPVPIPVIDPIPVVNPPNPVPVSNNAFGSKVFAPFCDCGLWPTINVNDSYKVTGNKTYTLAFVVAGSDNKLKWFGITDIGDGFYNDQLTALRNVGGDCIFSCGGASGSELSIPVTDMNALVAEYQRFINLYKIKWLDFDVEMAAIADPASIDRRNKAINILKKNNPGLKVSYTLPVLPTGLDNNGINMLKNIKANNTQIDVINVMSMDMGQWALPNPAGKMGDASIQAAQNTYMQVQQNGLNCTIGVCPMLGINDVVEEVFTIDDAKKLLNFATGTNYITWLSYWSENRNKYNPNETKWVSLTSSGTPQQPYEFNTIFTAFNKA